MRTLLICFTLLLNVGCASLDPCIGCNNPNIEYGHAGQRLTFFTKCGFQFNEAQPAFNHFIKTKECPIENKFSPIMGWKYDDIEGNINRWESSSSSLTEEQKLETDCYLVTGKSCLEMYYD